MWTRDPMTAFRLSAALAGAGLTLALALSPAAAQMRNPVDRFTQMFGRQAPADDADDDAPPVARPDSNSSVRIDRLENQIRNLTGQIEQLQFSMRQMQDQLRKYQEDTDFRLKESASGRPQRRSEDIGSSGIPPVVAQTPTGSTATPSDPRLRRSDAFDPASQPNAPGAPRSLGALPGATIPQTPVSQSTRLPGGPVASDAGAPMDLSGGRIASNGTLIEPTRGPITGSPLPSAGQSSSLPPSPGASPVPGQVTTPGGTIIASHEPFSPREEFDMANGYLKGGQYEAAEKGYSTFLQKNPKNRLVPEAVFNLGESYYLRGRHREAAEQYLKISTTYSNSSRAPEAMLRLGQSLVSLGAKEQACASFNEVPRKYPNASAGVKGSAEREAKKNAC